MALVAENALADALGALAPSETAVHWAWPDRLLVNGAEVGRLRVASDTSNLVLEPNWLVIGAEVAFAVSPRSGEPGEARDRTTLWEEGCAKLSPKTLLESWSRHLLSWIHRWREDGFRPVAETWRGRAANLGADLRLFEATGRFIGLDDKGGALLYTADGAVAAPLWRHLFR